jgi:hypothetical protein
MAEDVTDKDGRGCMLFLACFAIAYGVGFLTSEGWGWITLGCILFVGAVVDYIIAGR